MSNNDNSSQQGAEQRPGEEQTRETTEQRPEQEQTTEQTEARPEQEQKGEQAEQRPVQNSIVEKAFGPSPITIKAGGHRQVQQKRESGLTPELVADAAKDIDNVN